ncbi:hypothetical protein SK128_027498, partial [Halocaridina rubra]
PATHYLRPSSTGRSTRRPSSHILFSHWKPTHHHKLVQGNWLYTAFCYNKWRRNA